MRIFAISDLHLDETGSKPMDIFNDIWSGQKEKIISSALENKISDEDIILIPGDISWAMKLESAEKDFNFIEKLPGKKIILKGNHDYWWQSITAVREMLPKNIYAIQNDAIKIGNCIICGTRGWVLPEGENILSKEDEKIRAREEIRLDLSIKAAKKLKEKDEEIICIMHYPPFNAKREDSAFTKLIEEAGIKKVVYGHLHGRRHDNNLYILKGDVEYFLTSCDVRKNKLTFIASENN